MTIFLSTGEILATARGGQSSRVPARLAGLFWREQIDRTALGVRVSVHMRSTNAEMLDARVRVLRSGQLHHARCHARKGKLVLSARRLGPHQHLALKAGTSPRARALSRRVVFDFPPSSQSSCLRVRNALDETRNAVGARRRTQPKREPNGARLWSSLSIAMKQETRG